VSTMLMPLVVALPLKGTHQVQHEQRAWGASRSCLTWLSGVATVPGGTGATKSLASHTVWPNNQ
jgi:hypothetical protein